VSASVLVALSVGVANAYLAFVRPARYRAAHAGNTDGFRFASGAPVVGTLIAIAASILGRGSVIPAVLSVITLCVDTGGLPWFLVQAWHDDSFWGSRH
jgi:hypothetical protein